VANVILLPEFRPGNAVASQQSPYQNTKRDRTFAEAAASYVEHGGESRYLQPILDRIGALPLREVHPFEIRRLAEELYPDHQNSTKNRQGIAPTRAVMIHAYERGWCGLLRIKRFREERPKRKSPASAAWLHSFVRQCHKEDKPQLAALVLFMAATAARVSEAIRLEWSEVDLARRSALLLKTKTGTNSSRTMTDELVARLTELKLKANPTERVFGYRCRQSVNARIRAVCERAGISYKSSHACGRHTFATTAIDMGIDIRTAMHAGDWRSVTVFLGTYVHPRENAARIVADRLSQYQFQVDL
jgi:integrase